MIHSHPDGLHQHFDMLWRDFGSNAVAEVLKIWPGAGSAEAVRTLAGGFRPLDDNFGGGQQYDQGPDFPAAPRDGPTRRLGFAQGSRVQSPAQALAARCQRGASRCCPQPLPNRIRGVGGRSCSTGLRCDAARGVRETSPGFLEGVRQGTAPGSEESSCVGAGFDLGSEVEPQLRRVQGDSSWWAGFRFPASSSFLGRWRKVLCCCGAPSIM